MNMKRKLDVNTSIQPNKKKQKVSDASDTNGQLKLQLPSLLCRIHTMKIYNASNLDKSKYDKCQNCLEVNNYDSMHFIYCCIYCKHFVCNFCMSDLYLLNQLKRSPLNIIKDMNNNKKRNKSSNSKKKSKSNKKQKKTTSIKKNKNKYRYNPELNQKYSNHNVIFQENYSDDEGAIATRTRNAKRNK
eukprot:272586_1